MGASSSSQEKLSHVEEATTSYVSTYSEDSDVSSILDPQHAQAQEQQEKTPLMPVDQDDDDDDDGVPVVIVQLSPSRSTTTNADNTSNDKQGSTKVCTVRKQKALVAVLIPLVLAITVGFLTSRGLELPYPQISRVIDINAPPVDLPQGETISHIMETKSKETPAQQKSIFDIANAASTTNSFTRLAEAKEKPIPVVKYMDSEKIPAGVGVQKQSAAEALMCRESVINYVINATNGKDECQGLQKAFDETCSQEDEEEDEDSVLPPEGGGGEGTAESAEAIPNGGNRRQLAQQQQRRGTRQRPKQKQHVKSREPSQILWDSCYILYRKTSHCIHWLLSFIPHEEKPKFIAEDKVYRVYRKAKRKEIRKNERNQTMTTRRRRLDQNRQPADAAKDDDVAEADDDGNDLKDDDDLASNNADNSTEKTTNPQAGGETDGDDEEEEDEDEEEESEATQEPVKVKPVKAHQSLSLPTGLSHVSGKTLEKTLFLQQEDKVMSQVKKAVNATSNVTKTVDAREDAAASAKAVSDTNNLVQSVLNDPSSIEARACCASILNVYHENCNVDAEEEISDKRLFIVVLIMACCGMVKSLIRHFKVRWLPEAAGCILVGVASGYAASYFPHQDFSFDGNWFLRILVPPIVFEAALSIDKKSFNRHLVPIIVYSTVGTVMATFLTASMVYHGTLWLGRFCETIPYVESLIFGSLISSIDPIAVLSVLSNMGMTDTDTLYVLVFGESLLNDGVAIVLFHTLVQFLDANVIIDSDAIMNAVIHFLVVALGSILVGVGSGIMCTLYYWAFHGCQTPLVEVLMFLCWALLPYYVCDGIGWSGIVAAVTVGFVMDMYVIGLGDDEDDNSEHSHGTPQPNELFPDDRKWERSRVRQIFSGEGHLSAEARIHIHFVTEIVATMMETAIFAYLGLFLFSHRYHWNGFHVLVSILACCISRAIMIPILSAFANWITSMQKYQNRCRGTIRTKTPATGVIVDKKMQMVLWFAGLRGAMSFALVEHIPLFDAVTGEGTRVKAELKAMTSASIMFTVFVLGGSTNYFMEYVGLAPNSSGKGSTPRGAAASTNLEMVSLIGGGKGSSQNNGKGSPHPGSLNGSRSRDNSNIGMDNSKSQKTRQRLRAKGSEDTNA